MLEELKPCHLGGPQAKVPILYHTTIIFNPKASKMFPLTRLLGGLGCCLPCKDCVLRELSSTSWLHAFQVNKTFGAPPFEHLSLPK
jgi:hypothetical protein